MIGAVDRAESLSIMLCRELLAYHIADEVRVERIASTLNSKYPSHSYPIMLDEALKIGLPAERMPADVNTLLLQLNAYYSEMGQKATTDFDEMRAHGNELQTLDSLAAALVRQDQEQDGHYASQVRRWITMNDHSSWRRIERVAGKTRRSLLHVA